MDAPLHAPHDPVAAVVEAHRLAVVAMRGSDGGTPVEPLVDVMGTMQRA